MCSRKDSDHRQWPGTLLSLAAASGASWVRDSRHAVYKGCSPGAVGAVLQPVSAKAKSHRGNSRRGMSPLGVMAPVDPLWAFPVWRLGSASRSKLLGGIAATTGRLLVGTGAEHRKGC